MHVNRGWWPLLQGSQKQWIYTHKIRSFLSWYRRIPVYIHVYMCVCIYIGAGGHHFWVLKNCESAHTYIYTYIHTYIHMNIFIYIYRYIQIHTYICLYIYTGAGCHYFRVSESSQFAQRRRRASRWSDVAAVKFSKSQLATACIAENHRSADFWEFLPSTVRCGDENHSQKSALLHYTESGEQRVGFGEFLLYHHVQPIANRMAQHLEIISKNIQFSTRRTRILMGFIIYYLVLIVNPMGRILVRWKSFWNNLEMLCHPICNWL